MKKSLLILLLFLGVLTAYSETRIVEFPTIGWNNMMNIMDIQNVTLSDTATIIDVKVRSRRGTRFIINESFLITDNSEKYPLKLAKGITIGESNILDRTGRKEFSLIFEPIPVNSDRLLFKAGNLLMQLELGTTSAVPSGLPENLANPDLNLQLPEPVLAIDSTTVNVHILGYKPYMGNTLNYSILMMGGTLSELPPLEIDEKGNASVTFLLHGTGRFFAYTMGNTRIDGIATLKPGETVDLYIDHTLSGKTVMNKFRGAAFGKTSWHNGYYSAFDAADTDSDADMKIMSGNFGDYRMGADEYVDYSLAQYEKAEKKINDNTSLSILGKAKSKLYNKANLIAALGKSQSILSSNYRTVKKDFRAEIPYDSICCELKPEHYEKVAETVDVNDPYLMLLADVIHEVPSAGWIEVGATGSFLKETGMYINSARKFKSGIGSEGDVEVLKGLSNPFYAQSAELYLQDMKDILANDAAKFLLPTPDVAPDSIFEAIIAPHEGKVIMVDFWATWCEPCLRSIKQNEPEKSGELNSEDIVWIYIADESSPLPKYLEMIKDIKGLHYKLTEEQYAALSKKLNINGYPYYILVDSKGNNVYNSLGLVSHEEFKKMILDTLEVPAE
ncbi:MAG: TlpA family protein disulfide reductase [Paramuribaculum sp.]|nr:TlpA family protein disulfide reductase [Paramuribaculum sp.]